MITLSKMLQRRAAIALGALLATGLISAAPASADDRDRDRGRYGDRHDRRDDRRYDRRDDRRDWRHDRRDWRDDRRDHRRDWRHDRRDYRHYSYRNYYPAPRYGYTYYSAPSLTFRFGDDGYRGYIGLRPRECRWETVYDYWRGRPATIERQLCANGYGEIYIVQGSHRFLRYR
ncbi:hypothetical protein GC169_08520 [bacterium]|nr:hypothetical protein [bacterium]